MKIGGAKIHAKHGRLHTHTRRALIWAFLGRGSTPLGPDEDVPTIESTVATTAVKPDRTCKIPNR
jgi:hypothetical protein